MTDPRPVPISGFFRSKIYFDGQYYDTEWRIAMATKAGKTVPEVSIIKCMGGEEREQIFSLNYNPEFQKLLIRRARQIRESNS